MTQDLSTTLTALLRSEDKEALVAFMDSIENPTNTELTIRGLNSTNQLNFYGRKFRKITISGGTFESLVISNLELGNLEFVSNNIESVLLKNVQIEVVEFNSVRLNTEGKISIAGDTNYLSTISELKANTLLKNLSTLDISYSKIGSVQPTLSPTSNLVGRHSLFLSSNLLAVANTTCEVSFSDCEFERELVRGNSNTPFAKPWSFERCIFTIGFQLSNCHFSSGLLIHSVQKLGPELLKNKDKAGSTRCDLKLMGNHFEGDVIIKGKYTSIAVNFHSQGGFTNLTFDLDNYISMEALSIDGIRTSGSHPTIKVTGGTSKSLNIRNTTEGKHTPSFVCQKHNTEILNIKNLTFPSFKIEKSKLGQSQLSRVKFEGPVRFERVQFDEPPLFIETEFYFDTSFIKCDFRNRHRETVGSYRELKNLSKSIENEIDHLKFSSLELEARYDELVHTKSNLEDLFELLASCLYKLINNRGDNLIKPLYWLIAQFAVASIIYFLMMSPSYSTLSISSDPWDIGRAFDGVSIPGKSLALSAVSTLGPFRIFLPAKLFEFENLMIQMMSSVQLLLSSTLWFFFIFGIRRRFKVN